KTAKDRRLDALRIVEAFLQLVAFGLVAVRNEDRNAQLVDHAELLGNGRKVELGTSILYLPARSAALDVLHRVPVPVVDPQRGQVIRIFSVRSEVGAADT